MSEILETALIFGVGLAVLWIYNRLKDNPTQKISKIIGRAHEERVDHRYPTLEYVGDYLIYLKEQLADAIANQ